MEDQKTPIWLTNSNNNSLSNSDRSSNHGHHHHHHHHNQNLQQQIVKHHHPAQQQDIKDSEKPWSNSNPNSREFNLHHPHGFLHLNPETIPAASSSSTPPAANPNNINSDLHQTNNNNISVQTDLHQTSTNNSITHVQAELLNHNRHSHGINNLPSSDPLSVSAPPSLQCLLQPNTSSSSSSSSSLSSSSSSLSSSVSLSSRLKAEITVHPLYNQLLSAHVACLRIATPVDQLPLIDAQIARSPQISSKYLQILSNANSGNNMNQKSLDGSEDREELDQFMAHYVLLLCSFKEQLQQHVKVHAMEAVMACWDLEQSLLSLTGVSPGEASGATMSDDDDDYGYGVGGREDDLGGSVLVDNINGHHHDLGGYGPLIPTETERTLMEKVRQELKNELKNGYKDRIVDVREEILRKRRAGKLPGDTTSVLKSWWHCHAKWPYPTEDEKARLVQETGLQLKQINNWFINQRKRNWHSNPSSSSALKSKRKR